MKVPEPVVKDFGKRFLEAHHLRKFAYTFHSIAQIVMSKIKIILFSVFQYIPCKDKQPAIISAPPMGVIAPKPRGKPSAMT